MDYQGFVIKYTEIALKGKNRNFFEEALVKQIKRVLADCAGSFRVVRVSGRIYVYGEAFDFEETVAALQRVFGITAICPALTIERDGANRLPSIEALAGEAVRFIGSVYPGTDKSFKVHCRRVDKTYPMQSMEVDAYVGEQILNAYPTMRVDVHKPDIRLHIELREKVNLYSEILPGAGGMPTGTGGYATLLLSGGIDSPVAGYMVARRGVVTEAVYFHAPPYTSERAKQKVVDLAKVIARYTGGIRLHVINFTELQMYIYRTCPHDELTILMRRYMMRIAEKIAIENGSLGLVTGESIGQVASQTMQSLLVTDEVVETMPVYRPLIAYDKQEIIDISTRIGAFEISTLPYEDCCTIFVAKHPVTKPRPEVIRKHELLLTEAEQMMEKALREREIIEVDAS